MKVIVEQIKAPVNVSEKEVFDIAKARLKKTRAFSNFGDFYIYKRSIDARNKENIKLVFSVCAEVSMLKTREAVDFSRHGIKIANKIELEFVCKGEKPSKKPLIVGFGPGGMFCALALAKAGLKPIVIERGSDVDTRVRAVESFYKTKVLDADTNIQFGAGGAGTFSDGKLNTLINDPKCDFVLKSFADFGAPKEICYNAKPHIGTDILRDVVKNIAKEIISLGGEIHYNTRLDSYDNGIAHTTKGNFEYSSLVLAIGHSARDTYEYLLNKGVAIEAKPFSVGVRVEHLQSDINEAMYGKHANEFEPASYKIYHRENERGVYSFCMCPGGYVVNASSEEGRLAVNGMSYSDRGSENANSAIIVAVTPEDFGSEHPLAGIAFQRGLEEKAYEAGQGRIPVQRFGEFKHAVEMQNDLQKSEADTITEEHLADGGAKMCNQASCYEPCTKGEYKYTDLTRILPRECNQAFVEGMEVFAHQIKGFDRPDALMLGVESRTSSPVRIHRDEYLQSVIRGLYPCGEGAGYAGGITSAAMDGMRVAEEIAKRFAGF